MYERKSLLENQQPDLPSKDQQREVMRKLATYKMPFGKYKGYRLVDLPEPYVIWFKNRGFPDGELGLLLESVFEIKVNGLEYLFRRK